MSNLLTKLKTALQQELIKEPLNFERIYAGRGSSLRDPKFPTGRRFRANPIGYAPTIDVRKI
jgi:hypothetical protein